MGDPLWILWAPLALGQATPLCVQGNSINNGSLTTKLCKALVPASQTLNLAPVAAITSGNVPVVKTASNYTWDNSAHFCKKKIFFLKNPHI